MVQKILFMELPEKKETVPFDPACHVCSCKEWKLGGVFFHFNTILV